MKASALTRDNSKRIEALPKGKKHWNWNDKPNVNTLHRRIHRRNGPAKNHKCAVEGCTKKAFDWANRDGKYTDDVRDYDPLCRSHHVLKDKNWIKK